MPDVSNVANGSNSDYVGREWIGSCRVAVAQVLLVHSTDTEQD